MRRKKWTEKDLKTAATKSTSVRQVLHILGLREAGGNYSQIKQYLNIYQIDTDHFRGRGWNKGSKLPFNPKIPIEEILIENSNYQSYKLKKRLFRLKLKKESCEICNWSEKSIDGRIPLELDHINGNRFDNRIENLRVLCPNCHSLQSTHRGRNKYK